MFSFQQKVMKYNKTKSMIHTSGKKKSTETAPEEPQTLDKLNKDFESAILSICERLKGLMFKELQERQFFRIRMIPNIMENINKEVEII